MRRDLILRTKLIWQIELIPLRQLKGNRTFFFASFFPICMKKVLIFDIKRQKISSQLLQFRRGWVEFLYGGCVVRWIFY